MSHRCPLLADTLDLLGESRVTLEPSDMDVEQVMSVRDRSLEDSYEVHDVGYDILRTRLEAHGFHVVDHGDDARHAEDVFFGDGPDLAVYRHFDDAEETSAGSTSSEKTNDDAEEQGVDLLSYIEIKTKESPEWFGRCNRRHFCEYVSFRNEVDVPVWIWFALVDTDTHVCHRSGFFEVEDTDQIDGDVIDVSERTVVFHDEDAYELPDDEDVYAVDGSDVIGVRPRDEIVGTIPDVHGNDVVCLDDDEIRSFPHFLHRVESS